MKGFKDSTRTHYFMGGSADGPKGAAKVASVMHEWGKGRLHSGSKKGPVVKDQKQAVAIALNQAGEGVKKATGGAVGAAMPPSGATPLMAAKKTMAVNTQAMRGMQKMKAAMAARPKQGPMIKPQFAVQPPTPAFKRGGVVKKAEGGVVKDLKDATDNSNAAAKRARVFNTNAKDDYYTQPEFGTSGASYLYGTEPTDKKSVITRNIKMARKAASDLDAETDKKANTGAPGPSADSMKTFADTGAYKRGGKVMKKAEGGLATSVPRADDANEAANSFVNERAAQLREVVGKSKGGKVGKFGRW